MEKIKVIHDAVGHTLTVWFDDPSKESVCEETTEEVVLMKNAEGRVIGFELYHPAPGEAGLTVETVVKSEP
jgi:hypothetical protein